MSTPPNDPYVAPASGGTGGSAPNSPGGSGPSSPGGSPTGPSVLSRASRDQRGVGLVGLGAVVLFISLFLNWYEPGRSAWTVFEVWDLVLAVLSVVAVVGAAGRLGIVDRRPDSWLTGPAVASLVIVLVSLINHPPAATGAAPMFGIWLALLASIAMCAGVAISVGRVSVAINLHPHDAPPTPAVRPDEGPGRAAASGRMHWFRHGASASGPARTAPPAADPPADRPLPVDPPTSSDATTEDTRQLPQRPSDPPQASS